MPTILVPSLHRNVALPVVVLATLAAGIGSASTVVEPAAEAGSPGLDGELAPSSSTESQSTSLWTQWRGTARDGSSPGPAWPSDLSGLEPEWKVELARATDRESGETVWRALANDGAIQRSGTEVSDQPTWGHLAVSGDQLYIRELEGLKAYRLE